MSPPRQADDLVDQDILLAVVGLLYRLRAPELDVSAQAHHEGDSHAVPIPPEARVVVPAVRHHDAAPARQDVVGSVVVRHLAVRHEHAHGQEIVEGKEGVELHRALFLAVARPWENVEAERHCAGIQQLYARRVYTLAAGAAVGLLSQQFLAQPPIDLARHPRVAPPVLLAQRVSGGSLPYSQVAQLPPNALHAQLDVAQRLAIRQLAEYHGDKMCP